MVSVIAEISAPVSRQTRDLRYPECTSDEYLDQENPLALSSAHLVDVEHVGLVARL